MRDIFTDVLVGSRISGISMPTYKSTRTLKGEYQEQIPDWYFSLRLDNDTPVNFFLEFDKGEESAIQWKKKVEAIAHFWNSTTYKELYTTHRLRIPIVTTTERRLQSLLQWTVDAGGKNRFWFTTLDKVKPETVLTEDIWRVANAEGDHYLTEVNKLPSPQ